MRQIMEPVEGVIFRVGLLILTTTGHWPGIGTHNTGRLRSNILMSTHVSDYLSAHIKLEL